MSFEELADGEDLGPDLASLLEVVLDGEGIPQLHRQLGQDVGGTPDGSLGAGGKAVKGEGVPSVEGGNASVVVEEEVGQGRGISGRVLEVLDAHLGEASDF